MPAGELNAEINWRIAMLFMDAPYCHLWMICQYARIWDVALEMRVRIELWMGDGEISRRINKCGQREGMAWHGIGHRLSLNPKP